MITVSKFEDKSDVILEGYAITISFPAIDAFDDFNSAMEECYDCDESYFSSIPALIDAALTVENQSEAINILCSVENEIDGWISEGRKYCPVSGWCLMVIYETLTDVLDFYLDEESED